MYQSHMQKSKDQRYHAFQRAPSKDNKKKGVENRIALLCCKCKTVRFVSRDPFALTAGGEPK